MPRPKLIYHGVDDRLGPMWAPPTDDYRECPHPPYALRFYQRAAIPFWMYCRACGMYPIHPDHIYSRCSEEEKARLKAKAQIEADRILRWMDNAT